MNKSLTVDNISYKYNNGKNSKPVLALSDVSFSINEDDIVAVLGDSGCGKTTLLKCIAGLLDPYEGKVILNNENVTMIETRDRDIAYVFQTPFLYPHMTIYANVCAALSYYGLTRDEIDYYAKTYLIKYKMDKYINFKPKHLSLGEQQKISLIRAFIREPSLLMMDEPFSNIDLKAKNELMEMTLEEIKNHHIPTIMVTHDINDAVKYANKLLIMEKGKIIEYLSKDEFIKKPKTPLGKEYLSLYKETITN